MGSEMCIRDRWSQVPRSFVQRRSNGSIIFNADIVAAAFFMLSRWEEAITLDRDQHGRFPSASSVAYKQDFLHRPIVDEYALILRAWLEMLLPRWKPQIPHFRVFLTHDLDHPTRPTSWQKELRYAVGDVLKRHTLSQAMGRLKKMYLIKKDITNDEYFAEFRALMDVSEYYGFKSTFHFMASPGGPFDSGYDLRRLPYRSMVKEVIARGHQVGFHPGYSTYQNPQRFQEEKDRLAEVLGHEDFGGRHHYLRFSVPTTWRLWEESALLYDSTMGYADHNGFRCGTCHPFHPFDLERDREIDILERPLIVMDKILSQYHHHTPEQMIERVLQLARECQRVGGEFVLLWHNSPQDDIRPSGIVYRRIVERLAQVDHQDTAKML